MKEILIDERIKKFDVRKALIETTIDILKRETF